MELAIIELVRSSSFSQVVNKSNLNPHPADLSKSEIRAKLSVSVFQAFSPIAIEPDTTEIGSLLRLHQAMELKA